MIVQELKELLEDIPDNAEIMIEADHGQHLERAESFTITRNKFDDGVCNHADELIFEWSNWKDCYDEDAVEEYPVDGEITGVLISSYV